MTDHLPPPKSRNAGDAAAAPDTTTADHSPLWMVTSEPQLNRFVLELQQLRLELMQMPDTRREVRFSQRTIEQVRSAFANMIRHGEEDLHRLSQLICDTFLGAYQLQSVVIGAAESTDERFTLIQTISTDDLYSTTDLDLGTRQLNKLQFFDGQRWSGARLVANVVDYQPTEPNLYAIHRVTTRIKAEEAIWNKVVDEIWELDRLVVVDKKLRHLSRYVKDVFGIKIVVGEAADGYRVHAALLEQRWPDAALEALDVPADEGTRRLEFLEVKDYLQHADRKRSGWEAIKSVVRWRDKTFEIQIQPLRNFLHEREHLTSESHWSFKARREAVRREVAEQIPLFRFYGELLRWLFLEPAAPPPSYPNVTVLVDP